MSQLVPVFEVMIGVTWNGLPFDIWCQAQLLKENKKLASHKPDFGKMEKSYDLGFTQGYVVLHYFVNKTFWSAHFWM